MSHPTLLQQIEYALKTIKGIRNIKDEIEKIQTDGNSSESNIQPELNNLSD